PAEVGHLLPERVVVRAGLGQLAQLLGLQPCAEEVVRRGLDGLLVVVEVEVHRILGRPITRSAMMFLRISVVPPSIELARARRKRYVHGSSSSWARGPAMSIASSVSAWLTSAQCHLPSDPSGPGTPYFICAVSPR